MPAVKKITREEIIEGALNVIRDGGFASVNARSVAKKLGCSTQPIYLSFHNMNELKVELSNRIFQDYMKFISETIKKMPDNRYKTYAMIFVKYAKKERELFRYLYFESAQTPEEQLKIQMPPQLIKILQEEYGYDEITAYKFNRDMTFYFLGIAILVNYGSIDISDNELEKAFDRQVTALTSIYGRTDQK